MPEVAPVAASAPAAPAADAPSDMQPLTHCSRGLTSRHRALALHHAIDMTELLALRTKR